MKPAAGRAWNPWLTLLVVHLTVSKVYNDGFSVRNARNQEIRGSYSYDVRFQRGENQLSTDKDYSSRFPTENNPNL